jgi:plastocyanin
MCLLIAATTGAVAVPAVAAKPKPKTKTKTIKVGDDYFVKDGKKPTVTVARGTTVKWNWKGTAPHNVTVTKGPAKFSSKTQKKGSFSKKLTKRGTYKIVCTIHLPGMVMTLKVK